MPISDTLAIVRKKFTIFFLLGMRFFKPFPKFIKSNFQCNGRVLKNEPVWARIAITVTTKIIVIKKNKLGANNLKPSWSVSFIKWLVHSSVTSSSKQALKTVVKDLWNWGKRRASKRHIDIQDDYLPHLKEWLEKTKDLDNDYLFPSLRTKGPISAHKFRTMVYESILE